MKILLLFTEREAPLKKEKNSPKASNNILICRDRRQSLRLNLFLFFFLGWSLHPLIWLEAVTDGAELSVHLLDCNKSGRNSRFAGTGDVEISFGPPPPPHDKYGASRFCYPLCFLSARRWGGSAVTLPSIHPRHVIIQVLFPCHIPDLADGFTCLGIVVRLIIMRSSVLYES